VASEALGVQTEALLVAFGSPDFGGGGGKCDRLDLGQSANKLQISQEKLQSRVGSPMIPTPSRASRGWTLKKTLW